MKEMHKDLERAVDRAVFKTEEPEKIKRLFTRSFDAWERETATLGGYLRDIRLLRGLTAEECAQRVGVSRARWQSWEADRETPTETDLCSLCRGMEFGERKREELFNLKARAPRNRLLAISRLRPELLAARGGAKLESSLEWKKLPGEVQKALMAWGKQIGLSSFAEVMEFFTSLPDEEAREAWVDEVLERLG